MRLKISLLLVFSLVGFAPLIQSALQIFDVPLLLGYYTKEKQPSLSFTHYLSGAYQDSMELYLKDNIGFGNSLIRLNNQLDFSLYKLASTDKTIVGKNRMLFEETYIFAHRGDDFEGSIELRDIVKGLKELQQKLKEKGIFMLFIIAPGKASYFEELIPKYYHFKPTDSTNYKVVASEFIKQEINHINFREYFLQLKPNTPYPLFPRNGIHWSYYGVWLVMDSIVKCIEKNTSYDLIDMTLAGGYTAHTSSEIQGTDNDIGKALNLICEPSSGKLFYPDISFGDEVNKDKPNILSVGDSFNKNFFNSGPYFSALFGDKSRFWYYNQTVEWPVNYTQNPLMVEDLDIEEEIKKTDIVLIVATEPNLDNPGFYFQDLIIPYLLPDSLLWAQPDYKSNKIKKIILSIKRDPKWIELIEKKAELNNIDVEEQLQIDAEWYFKYR